MRRFLLVFFACGLPLFAAEGLRAFPLWDGKETVKSYADRVGMAATKSIDLGGGVSMELVLIPAGEFVMGSAAPEKPRVTVAGAVWIFWIGGGVAALLILALLGKYAVKKRFSFSLRWLLLMTMAMGACVGGFARVKLAEKEEARYESEMKEFEKLPANEKPAHSVTIAQPFYMGKYTVTEEQYNVLMRYYLILFKGTHLPVKYVSWDEATEFCKTLNGKSGDTSFEARLPTEAEWEYACRAGTRTRFYSGDSDGDLDAAGWFDANSGRTIHPVGQKKPNAFGLYDMHGNIYQWCQDFYKDSYAAQAPSDPGAKRVVRGGCWFSIAWLCRSSSRYGSPDTGFDDVGFRVVVVVPAARP
ncbi:MAG TPA: formylglycine-generating enzyme family protein [Planctomycetota bacterium]|nr:formylglycine-generating enzyme family protein [Planctomycetota bacterium]